MYCSVILKVEPISISVSNDLPIIIALEDLRCLGSCRWMVGAKLRRAVLVGNLTGGTVFPRNLSRPISIHENGGSLNDITYVGLLTAAG